jgi:hypothetical protein
MATRSRIGIENENGTVTSIYCHWDGYPENNGAILHKHYTNREKVQKLIDLGSISSLAPEIDAPEGHTFETPVGGVVVAYHRDRGESLQHASHRNIQCFFNSDIEAYGYVFNQKGEWLVKRGFSKKGIMPQLLTRILSGEEYLV